MEFILFSDACELRICVIREFVCWPVRYRRNSKRVNVNQYINQPDLIKYSKLVSMLSKRWTRETDVCTFWCEVRVYGIVII